MSFWKKRSDEEGEEQGSMVPAGHSDEVVTVKTVQSVSTAVAPVVEKPNPVQLPAEEGGEGLDRYGKVRSALGVGTVIQGKLSFDTPVRIDGKLGGEVFSTKALIVGKTGQIQADMQVAVLVVYGKVKGSIKATERVELLSGGSLEGEIVAPLFVMEEGAVFNGTFKMQNAAGNKVVSATIRNG